MLREMKHWVRLLPPVAVVAATAAGCAELPASARQNLIRAEVQYRDQDYRGATTTLDAFIEEYPRHTESAEAYYLRALCHTNQSNKARANADVQRCIGLSRDPELVAKAHAMVGSLLFESGKLEAAKAHYAKALRAPPDWPQMDLVRYRYGLCLQRTGQWKRARLEFAAVYQRYPASVLAEHARRMYDWPHDYFAIQCGAYRDKSGAEALVRKLKKADLQARTESRPRLGVMLHKVFVGHYPTYVQAADALRSVRRQVPDALAMP